MKAKYSNYIVIKGIDWLMFRLDEIGYSPCNIERMDIFRKIWRRDKSVSDELLRSIIGGKYEKQAI